MRIEESDVVIYEVDLWKFVKEVEDNFQKGFKVKSYELSAFCPSHNGIAYHVVMEKVEPVAKEATNVAEQATASAPVRRAPPVRQSKKQAE